MLLRCPPSDLRANHDRWYRPFDACYRTALLIGLMLGLMLVQRSLMLSGTCQHFLMRVDIMLIKRWLTLVNSQRHVRTLVNVCCAGMLSSACSVPTLLTAY